MHARLLLSADPAGSQIASANGQAMQNFGAGIANLQSSRRLFSLSKSPCQPQRGGDTARGPARSPRPEQGVLSRSPLSPGRSGRFLQRRVQDAPPGPRPPALGVLPPGPRRPASGARGRPAGRAALGPLAGDRDPPGAASGRAGKRRRGREGRRLPPAELRPRCPPAWAQGPRRWRLRGPGRWRSAGVGASLRRRGEGGALSPLLGWRSGRRQRTWEPGLASVCRLSERPGAPAAADRRGQHRRGAGDTRREAPLFNAVLPLAAPTACFLNPPLTHSRSTCES